MIKVYNSQTHQWQSAELKTRPFSEWACPPVFINTLDLWKPAYKIMGTFGVEWNKSGRYMTWTDDRDKLPYLNACPYDPDYPDRVPFSPFDFAYPWCEFGGSGEENFDVYNHNPFDPQDGLYNYVTIPKYYYKWTDTSSTLKLQISSTNQSGFHVSPAHAARVPNGQEADEVYVGAFLSANNPSSGIYDGASAIGRTDITSSRLDSQLQYHRGDDLSRPAVPHVWAFDAAMFYTIAMLCIVEYGSWNPEAIIGSGIAYGDRTYTGATYAGTATGFSYHTGRTEYNQVKYRNIEDLWCNEGTFINGVRRDWNDSNKALYGTNNPNEYSLLDSNITSTTKLFNSTPSTGMDYMDTQALGIPSANGFEYLAFPTSLTQVGSGMRMFYDAYDADPEGWTDKGCIIVGDNNIPEGIFRTRAYSTDLVSLVGAHRRLQGLPHV